MAEAKGKARRWSAEVTRRSNALDLEDGVFRMPSAREVACSLKRSADASSRRKTTPFRSAMSMLVFYLNRAGVGLAPDRRRVLEGAKDELRQLYGRPPARAKRAARRAALTGRGRRPRSHRHE